MVAESLACHVGQEERTMIKMASVRLRRVTKRFGPVTSVNDINLTIEDKEFLVLLGPSGCGKTTTLRMVAGLEELTEGQIYIGDQDVSLLPPKDRDIAMVFQNYALYPHMTVYENMAFGLKLRKTPKNEIDRRVTEAAEILGLPTFLQRRPKELSGGQRQRVALGRAIVRDPKVFLMDEPLSNLDAKLRTQTRVELKRLHQRFGVTILYVTHDQTEAMTMGTRIVVMRDGFVQQVDTPEGIYRRPVNEFVATFVGTPAMNLLIATVATRGRAKVAKVENQDITLPSPLAQAVEKLPNSNVRLGIRPEDIYFVSESQRNDTAQGLLLRGTVRVIEPLGHEQVVYCDVGSQQVVVRTNNSWVGTVQDRVTMAIDPAGLHGFNSETQSSLLVAAVDDGRPPAAG